MEDQVSTTTIRASVLTLAITALSAGGVSAAAMDWYGGVGLGLGKSKDDFTAIDIVDDDKDIAWKLFGGYQFQPNAAVELGYVDFGEYKGKGTFLGSPVTDKFSPAGFDLSLVGKFPVGRDVSVLGRIGAMRWDVDDKISVPGVGSGSESKTGVDATFGIGAQFDFTSNMAARIEWERFNNVGDEDTTGETNIDLFSASFVFTLR
jgi:OOP family OmpA-OmpF porin